MNPLKERDLLVQPRRAGRPGGVGAGDVLDRESGVDVPPRVASRGSVRDRAQSRKGVDMRGHLARWLSSMFVAALVATAPAAPALAQEDFKATMVLRATSVEVVGDELLLEAEGQGHSKLLGAFTVTASIRQTLVPGCDPATGEFTLSAEGGTLDLFGEGLVCFTGVTGTWEVTGGSGEFSAASGGGTFMGTVSHAGNAPVVNRLEGTLSF